jgi:uncharacterized protein YcfL
VLKGNNMKMKRKCFFIIATVFALILASCASDPATAEDSSDGSRSISVTEAKKSADEAKAKADEVKAPKAAPTEYEEALSLYDKAAVEETAENGDEAIDLYDSSTVAFTKAKTVAEEAREAALAAMAEVDKAISETELKAEEADETLESTEEVE